MSQTGARTPNRHVTGPRTAERAAGGVREGRQAERAAGGRWRVRRSVKVGYALRPPAQVWEITCPARRHYFRCDCTASLTHADAIAYVDRQIRRRALDAIQNQEAPC